MNRKNSCEISDALDKIGPASDECQNPYGPFTDKRGRIRPAVICSSAGERGWKNISAGATAKEP
jgi:hypothetical protein